MSATPTQVVHTERIAQQKLIQRQRIFDHIFRGSTLFFAAFILILLISILLMLVNGSLPAIQKFGFGFFSDPVWEASNLKFGALNAILGTLFTAFIAMLLAVPVSFGIAVFITELAPVWMRRPLGLMIELLAGIPSIIYGLWGALWLAPKLVGVFGWIMENWGNVEKHGWLAGWFVGDVFDGEASTGTGLLTSGIVLAIMIIPFITSVMRDVFEIVPSVLKESAYGLGATTWEVVRNIVLPFTKIGVIGGLILGLGRALGETMAVTYIIGGSNHVAKIFTETGAFSIFSQGNSIASTIALEFSEATETPLHISSLLLLGLTLFFITFIVLSISKLLLLQLAKKEGVKS